MRCAGRGMKWFAVIAAVVIWPGFAWADFEAALLAQGAGNYKQAAELYRKSAARGDPRSITNLGFLYMKGLGVEKAPETAVKLYRQAAGQGFSVAEYNLGLAYRRGTGVGED